MYIVDEKNDYIAVVYVYPNERGFFGKMIGGKKSTVPDYIKGVITRKSQCDINLKDKSFTPKEKHFVFSKIEGEWSDSLKIDDTIYWDYSTFGHHSLELVEGEFILPSDTTKREDLIVLKLGNESTEIEDKDGRITKKGQKVKSSLS